MADWTASLRHITTDLDHITMALDEGDPRSNITTQLYDIASQLECSYQAAELDLSARAEIFTREEERLLKQRQDSEGGVRHFTEQPKAQVTEDDLERSLPRGADVYQRCHHAEGENTVLREWVRQLQEQLQKSIDSTMVGLPGGRYSDSTSHASADSHGKRARRGNLGTTALPNKQSRSSTYVELVDMTGTNESNTSFKSLSDSEEEVPEQDSVLGRPRMVPTGRGLALDDDQQQTTSALSKSIPPRKATALPALALPTPHRSLVRPNTVRRPRDFGEVVQSVEDILPELDFLDEGSASGRSPATDLPQRVLTAFEPYLECHLTFRGEKIFRMNAKSRDIARCAVARLFEVADHELPITQREACEWCCKNNALCILVTREYRKLILPRPADDRRGHTVRDAGYWVPV
ncbi:hypothetical protein LTR37_001243 [Vermiconidia calcicola]|uniref:Uncharacterized protein n=1 Tax=Vermiconidia calcicola TaxID=1690605 RepID=A0ACC3NYS0_9PEZI|nr:hypothetical protein LTR37_001243 [Vermiconidia calcicola]